MFEPQFIPVEYLVAGEVGRIARIDGDAAAVVRLAEMGLQQGVSVRMVRPGRPCILAVGNHRLSFRGDETAIVLVEICNDGQAAGSPRAQAG
ncbi:MAG: FeoA domain-containing protein [Planctomycetaceae bacterium]